MSPPLPIPVGTYTTQHEGSQPARAEVRGPGTRDRALPGLPPLWSHYLPCLTPRPPPPPPQEKAELMLLEKETLSLCLFIAQ